MRKLLATFVPEFACFSVAGAQGPKAYTTTFQTAENPISESGRWINGQSIGLDWKDVQTTLGLAYGADASGTPHFNDPTAILTGSWRPNQTVQGTVHSVNQRGDAYQEVELRLRTILSGHQNAGYEVNFRCTHDGSQYVQIVRWNGPLGKFTYLAKGVGPGIRDGDVVKASIDGSVITAYINGVQVLQATDGTFTNGSPGIGFYLLNGAGSNADYGFKTLTATDGSGPAAPLPPTDTGNIRTLGRLLRDPDATLHVTGGRDGMPKV